MNHLKSLLFACLILLLSQQAFSLKDSIFSGGQYRTYELFLPSNYNSLNSLPLLIAMHGGFGSGSQLENQSQLSVKAENENYIVVYPDGVKDAFNIRTWNAGGCCGYAKNNNIDDVAFIENLISDLASQYKIDTNLIYATGMSNGAFMSYRLACELSDKITAIAPVAGSMYVPSCNPQRPVPTIHFHSYKDSNVPFNGGHGNGVSNHYNPPLDSVFNALSALYGCSNNIRAHDSLDFTLDIWNNCDCQARLELYISKDGGHSWHGGKKTVIGDSVSEFISANDLMFDFFEQYSLGCFTNNSISPISNKLKIQYLDNEIFLEGIEYDKLQIMVFNIQGQGVIMKHLIKNERTLNIRHLPKGIYFVVLKTSDNKYLTEKVIKF